MVSRMSERVALTGWIVSVLLCLLAVWNVALEPSAGAWRALLVVGMCAALWFGIWRRRRRSHDGTLDRLSRDRSASVR